MVTLAACFAELFYRLGIEPPIALRDELLAHYRGPTRHYHNDLHLLHCMLELADYRHGEHLAIEAALWFHDAIYDPTRHDNEERSADLAVARLSALALPPDFIAHVKRLVLATKHSF